jgi:AsmA family
MAEGAADSVRLAKWTSIIVGSLLLLVVITAFVMTSVIDPNRYRGKVEAIVGDLAGRSLVIEGDLEITWFPWLGVRMGSAHLENRPGVVGLPITQWQSIAVAAKVVPLLKGQVVIDRIRLQSPHIRLRRDAQGRGNWEDLGPHTPSSSARRESPPQIAGIEIRDGIVDYVDERSGLQVNVSSLELDVGEWRAGQPLPVHTRFLVHTDSLPPSGVWMQLDAPEFGVRLEPLNVTAPKVSIKVADALLDGDLTYEAGSQVKAQGSIAVRAPSVRKLAADLALNQTLPHDPTTLGPLELTTHWSYVDGALAAKPLNLTLDGVTFDGWIDRSAPPQSAWRFELHGDYIDLGRYVKVDSTNKKPFELPVDALRAINANGSLVFDRAEIADTHLTDVRLKIQTPETRQ